MRPNVLLVVFDTARADAFEPYGAPIGTTPAVAQMATGPNGVAHQRMFSTACWTAPAHGSLFTGRLPRATNLATGMPHEFKAAMAAVAEQTLPAALTRAGYATAGLSANPWISAASGFDAGFERFTYLETERNPKLVSRRPWDRAGWYLDALRARADDGAVAIEHLMADWLGRRERRPFFWFVNLMECHSPYLPPKPYSPLGPVGRIRAARDASRHCTVDALFKVAAGGWDIDDGALERMRAMYDASIRQLDDWLARVLQSLDTGRVLDDTLVIVTSDHGENFGEGHLFGHTYSLDDRLLHIPFVATGPVELAFDEVASIADIPGALAEAVDVHDERLTPTPRVPGVVVAQMDAVGVDGDPRVDAAIERWGVGEAGRLIVNTSFACAADGAIKLIRRLGREELIDLADDPLELTPIAVDGPIEARYFERLGPLRRALDLAEAAESTAIVNAAVPDADAAEVAALEEQMRLLGYL